MNQLNLTPRASALRAALYTQLYPRVRPEHRATLAMDIMPAVMTLRKNEPLSLASTRKAVFKAIQNSLGDKLANDADVEDVAALLDAIENIVDQPATSVPEGMEEEIVPPEAELYQEEPAAEEVHDAEESPVIARIREFLKNLGVSDEVLAQFDQLVASEKEPEEVAAEPEPEPVAEGEGGEEGGEDNRMGRDNVRVAGLPKVGGTMRPPVARHAMDEAAIARMIDQKVSEERDRIQAVYVAKEAVAPVVGKLNMAFDSADEVYGAALRSMKLGDKIKNTHPSAYRTIFEIAVDERKNATRNNKPRIAADAAASGVKSFAEMFPDAAKVNTH